MAVNFNDSDYVFSGLPIGFSRNNPIPLDKTDIWDNLDNLKDYAKNNPTAYVGQILTYVDKLNKTTTIYVISNENGDIQELGANSVGELESRLDGIDNILNGDTGLVTKVSSLETELGSVKDSISSVFKYKGAKDNYSDLLLIDNPSVGDVWSVGEAEYAWNGTEWFELGDMVNLDGYATKDYADQAAANVQTNLDTLSQTVTGIQQSVGQHTTDISDIKTTLEEHQTTLDTLTTLPNEFEVLSQKVGQAEKTDDLGNVTSEATGIYREMQFIGDKLDEITSVGGEPNIIERVFAGSLELTPVNKIVTIPVYSLDKASPGLVPVVNAAIDAGQRSNYFLSMDGTWAIPRDVRIGDLNGFGTVEEYVDNAIDAALTWSPIVE